MFIIGLFWIFFTKKEVNAGLMFLWGLEFEPAPSDFVFGFSWLKRILRGDFKWISHPVLHLLLAFILLNFLQIFYSASLSRGLFFGFVTVYLISLSFYFSSYIRNDEIWNEVRNFYLIAVYISGFILALMILLLFIRGRLGRPDGFFKDPNVLGAFMATGALYSLSRFLFEGKERILKHAIISLLLFALIVLTFSRGSLLNLLSGVLFLGFISIVTKRSKRFLIILLIALLVSLLSIPVILEVFKQSFRFRAAQWYDIYGRAMAWKAGIELFKNYPLGIGPGQFEIYSVDYQKSIGGALLITPSAHNLYLRVLAENGIIGFMILITILFGILFVPVRSKKLFYSSDITWIYACLVGIIVQSFVIDTLHWRHFWILLGFLISLVNLKRVKIN